jgi:hypothetical protein
MTTEQLARNLLAIIDSDMYVNDFGGLQAGRDATTGIHAAMSKLEEALAQPEQSSLSNGFWVVEVVDTVVNAWPLTQEALLKIALCTEDVSLIPHKPEQPEQGPVAHFGSAYINENGVHITTVLGPVAIPQDAKLYTTPPQRKPLTVDEVWQNDQVASYMQILSDDMDLLMEVIKAVEAAHGIGETHD